MPLRRCTVIFLCPASLGFRLLFIAHDVRDLAAHGPLYDDSFYSFGIARNIALGYGFTFDHEHLTNGYQPLWVGLLVPLYALCGAHPTLPIYAARIVSAILNGCRTTWPPKASTTSSITNGFSSASCCTIRSSARFEPIADAALLGVPGWRALRVVHDVPVVHARPETHTEPVVGTGGGGAGR